MIKTKIEEVGHTLTIAPSYRCGAQDIIDACKEPLIGLQYLTEFTLPAAKQKVQYWYLCNLCEAKFQANCLVSHCIAYKHRLNYMRERFMNYYMMVNQFAKKMTDRVPLVEEYSASIEQEEGRQPVKTKRDEKKLDNDGASGSQEDDDDKNATNNLFVSKRALNDASSASGGKMARAGSVARSIAGDREKNRSGSAFERSMSQPPTGRSFIRSAAQSQSGHIELVKDFRSNSNTNESTSNIEQLVSTYETISTKGNVMQLGSGIASKSIANKANEYVAQLSEARLSYDTNLLRESRHNNNRKSEIATYETIEPAASAISRGIADNHVTDIERTSDHQVKRLQFVGKRCSSDDIPVYQSSNSLSAGTLNTFFESCTTVRNSNHGDSFCNLNTIAPKSLAYLSAYGPDSDVGNSSAHALGKEYPSVFNTDYPSAHALNTDYPSACSLDAEYPNVRIFGTDYQSIYTGINARARSDKLESDSFLKHWHQVTSSTDQTSQDDNTSGSGLYPGNRNNNRPLIEGSQYPTSSNQTTFHGYEYI